MSRAFGRVLAALVAGAVFFSGSAAISQECDPDVCANPWRNMKSFATLKSAQAHCSAGPVVWVMAKTRVYHTAASPKFGRSKPGAYACENTAKRLGGRRIRPG